MYSDSVFSQPLMQTLEPGLRSLVHNALKLRHRSYIITLQQLSRADARAGRHYEPGTEMTEADVVLKLLRTVKKDAPTEWHLTCPSCIRDMQIFYDNGDEAQYSIDRIDSTLAHVKGNIQIICLRCKRPSIECKIIFSLVPRIHTPLAPYLTQTFQAP